MLYLFFLLLLTSLKITEHTKIQSMSSSLSTITTAYSPPLPSSRLRITSIRAQSLTLPDPDHTHSPSPSSTTELQKLPTTTLSVTDERTKRIAKEVEKLKLKEMKERKEMKNQKVASQKAVSVILRREATKAIIDKRRKKGPVNSKKLLPRTVLEALNERIVAFRWESALKVYFFLTFG
jgi:flagellar motor protein MotB